MAKMEWGTKRTCPNCGARYYDLSHDPIVCPKCGSAFDPEALLKTRRVRVPVPVEPVAPPAAVEEEIDTELEDGTPAEPEEEGEEAVPAEGEEEEEEEEEVLEDASELGEDQDDMAEVIENVEDEEER
jgi:uncharacterized protein (TIGR02300 family)